MKDLNREILQFEGQWWQQRGNKEAEIRRVFGMSAVRYAQKLNNLLDDPEAHRHDPILVNRLRRLRTQRVTARAQRRDLL